MLDFRFPLLLVLELDSAIATILRLTLLFKGTAF